MRNHGGCGRPTASLLIIDWNVPGFAALEVIQGLRRGAPLQTVRVIILSYVSTDEHVVRGLKLGRR